MDLIYIIELLPVKYWEIFDIKKIETKILNLG